MEAYSLDLRTRIVAARQAGGSEAAVATRFSVSVSFVAKLMRRFRASGSAAALPRGHGPAPVLAGPALGDLTACVRQTPDATLTELCVWLAATGGPAVSRSAVGRAVRAADWRRKKKRCTPPSATRSGC